MLALKSWLNSDAVVTLYSRFLYRLLYRASREKAATRMRTASRTKVKIKPQSRCWMEAGRWEPAEGSLMTAAPRLPGSPGGCTPGSS